ncbi:MAG: SDR family NAD(P)-dependent oxidoreductase [Elusimicrobia bacterium]|nr:SDR family NAD(P)-dependent oxidoreductase [Candidatus Obscuribacterium magneticum]
MNHLDYYRGKTVLVTGGAGAIGSNLCRRLAELGCRMVVILDDMSAAYEWNAPLGPNILFVKGSIVDEVALKRVLNENPEIVFHLAAFFANQRSVDYPELDLEVNGRGTLRLLQYCQMKRVDRFVYASSGCSIYGHQAPLPLKEEFMSMHLTTPYQVTKMLGELYCNFFSDHYGMKIVKARFFNSYGPGEVPGQYRNVIPNFIYWALRGQPLPITGNASATRDFTYVDDLVDGILRCGFSAAAVGREFNLSSATETSIGSLAETINRLAKNKAGVFMAGKRKWDTKSRLLASLERSRSVLGYQPAMELEEGLKKTMRWFKAHWADIERSASFSGMSSAVREQVTLPACGS